VRPYIDNLIISFTAGDNTFTVLIVHLRNFLLGMSDNPGLSSGIVIRHSNRNACLGSPDETQGFHIIQRFTVRDGRNVYSNLQSLTDSFFIEQLINKP